MTSVTIEAEILPPAVGFDYGDMPRGQADRLRGRAEKIRRFGFEASRANGR